MTYSCLTLEPLEYPEISMTGAENHVVAGPPCIDSLLHPCLPSTAPDHTGICRETQSHLQIEALRTHITSPPKSKKKFIALPLIPVGLMKTHHLSSSSLEFPCFCWIVFIHDDTHTLACILNDLLPTLRSTRFLQNSVLISPYVSLLPCAFFLSFS